jgi:type 1 glutamine amidotransferase
MRLKEKPRIKLLMKKLLLALATIVMATSAIAADAPKKLLAVSITLGYRHSSIPTGEKILSQLAQESGAFTVDFVRQPSGQPEVPRRPAQLKADATPEEQAAHKKAQDAWREAQAANEKWSQASAKIALEKLSPESLRNYDGVIFLSTTGNLPLPDREGFMNWLKSGKAFIGVHSASDTLHEWREYVDMIGGEFVSHGPQVGVECLCKDEKHPSTSHLGKSWKISQEEIYLFKNYDPTKVHDLLVLDKQPNNKSPGHFPVSWTKDHGKGRVFYTSLGHREDIWDADPTLKDRVNSVETSKAFQAHLLGGIKWALGQDK